jgi:hypothetical protein
MANASDINARFQDLRISTDYNSYSGFTAEDLENDNVRILDDYDSVDCDPDAVLAELAKQEPVNLGELDRFWQIFFSLSV